jgi:uncharacterized protein (DUF924 family)
VTTPEDILRFWIDETPREKWFAVDAALDAEIGRRFEPAWQEARTGALDDWPESADGALALILLLDQFPRNMFRGRAEAFATDAKAREIADRAVARGFDLRVPEQIRHFFYLPFQHSENLEDQETAVRLTVERLGETHYSYPYALAHRDVIRRFGRFPARNGALGRDTTDAEAAFLATHPGGF